ncbi:hypothetical protein SCTVLC_2315 [Serratia symbiotica SCt-VLC]|uniref:Uncharacterized protein n=1 Tax=Serratia symbiotica SCt-VLC TaxID=1347341 RepID=A0A068RFI4_9GAMM|nr:hypothetical protein SCTVLC_2315 [Serratia symbiotica SCt-VLC]
MCLEAIFICHFNSGQCSQSSRTLCALNEIDFYSKEARFIASFLMVKYIVITAPFSQGYCRINHVTIINYFYQFFWFYLFDI